MKRTIWMLILSGFAVGVAHAGSYVVIVHPAMAGATNMDEVPNIFLGKVTSYANGKPAVPFDGAEGATRTEFCDKVLKKEASTVKAYWAKMKFTGRGLPPKELANDDEIRKSVAATPGGIGYISKSAVDGTVKVVGEF
ncbi:hypothetical protein KSF73_14965 [Burkholderiaceae bacterium DAT-1]|nr:hypothetical protein [Burkholderiaceae bacterium DAT-1]